MIQFLLGAAALALIGAVILMLLFTSSWPIWLASIQVSAVLGLWVWCSRLGWQYSFWIGVALILGLAASARWIEPALWETRSKEA